MYFYERMMSRMEKKKIAVQLFSVRDAMKDDFYGTLKQVKAFGYDGVEFAGLFGHSPEEVRQMCQELELVPISAHVSLALLMEDMEGTIECYRTIGCKYIAIPYLPEDLRPGTDGFPKVIEFAKVLGKALADKGMVLQYHNHDFEFVKLDGKYALDVLYEQVGPELLQTQLDTCWVNVGGENPVDYIKKYAGRVPTVHLKDFVGRKTANMYQLIGIDDNQKQEAVEAFAFRALGRGVQNIPAIVEASIEGGAEWFIVEQDMATEGYSPMESIQISARYLLEQVFA